MDEAFVFFYDNAVRCGFDRTVDMIAFSAMALGTRAAPVGELAEEEKSRSVRGPAN